VSSIHVGLTGHRPHAGPGPAGTGVGSMSPSEALGRARAPGSAQSRTAGSGATPSAPSPMAPAVVAAFIATVVSLNGDAGACEVPISDRCHFVRATGAVVVPSRLRATLTPYCSGGARPAAPSATAAKGC